MNGDELDRTIEFLLQNAARSDARFEALHRQNLRQFAKVARAQAKLADGQATFQLQLNELSGHVSEMTETLTATLTAMDERDVRQDKRLAKLESQIQRVDLQIEQIGKIVHSHVSDPHAHGPSNV